MSGRRILSLILPKINLQNNMVYEDMRDETHKQQNRIKIENGEIIDGVFDKSLWSKAQGLVHVILMIMERNDEKFLDSLQNIVTNWLITSGLV